VLHTHHEPAAQALNSVKNLVVVGFSIHDVHEPLGLYAERVHTLNLVHPPLLQRTRRLASASARSLADHMAAQGKYAVRASSPIAAHRKRHVRKHVLVASRALTKSLSIPLGTERQRRRIMQHEHICIARHAFQRLTNMWL
jgi:hypothetical protein